MILKIRKHQIKPSSHDSALLLGIIIWYVIAALLTGFLGLPKSLVYFGDVLNVWLFIKAVCRFRNEDYKIQKNPALFCMILFSLIGICSSFANLESPLLTLWGIRQNFRYFIFYFSCIMFLKEKDVRILIRIIAVLFWVSIPLCAIEALFITYPRDAIIGDYVGGVYYGIQGANAPLNVILIIYCTNVVLRYLDNKCKFKLLLATLVSALFMAALSELKVFLVEIVIIAVMAMILKGISLKGVVIMLIGIIGMGIAINVFVQINARGRSYYTTDYLSFSGMLENVFRDTGYDGVGDLNRFTAVPVLTEKFFSNDIVGFMFGLGLGNADYSLSYEFLQSKFYQSYSWLHYQWFSISFVFIETGALGLILYILIFTTSLQQGLKRLKRGGYYRGFYSIMLVMMFILLIYNPSLRNEQCGFLLYLILSIPYAINGENEELIKEISAKFQIVMKTSSM